MDLVVIAKLLSLACAAIAFRLFSNYLPLRTIPGPKLYATSKWRLAFEDWSGRRSRTIHKLHQKYGLVVRIGPKEVSFNSLTALKTIYGAGSGFERTAFYRMFDVYGEPNLFTFATPKDHGERKKLLNHAYAKSSIFKNSAADIEEKAFQYLELLEREPKTASEIFSSLHYYSLDNITHFLYGERFGATSAMEGSAAHRQLLNDVLDPDRRRLAWFAAHLPRYTKWLLTRTGHVEKMVSFLFPQKKPTVYTGIRKHALEAWHTFNSASEEEKADCANTTIMGRLWKHHEAQKKNGLNDMELASEAADHLLAGVDTTADSLMFLIYALSKDVNKKYHDELVNEVKAIPESGLNSKRIPTVEATSKLPYLNAVIMETLRLYAPLPASEPRSLPVDTVIDGLNIPANTVVGMSPFSLHRNAEIFDDPLVFKPQRWLGNSEDVTLRKKWFW